MRRTNKQCLIGLWFAVIIAAECAGCGGGGSSGPPPPPPTPITVTVSPTTPIVLAGQMQQFTATLTNDSSMKGVTWSLSGPACSGAACGTLSGINTTSTTYMAPASVPSNLAVALTATSVADTTKSSQATITVPATATAACGSGNESLLAAGTPYAFLFQGFVSSGPFAMSMAIAGSFTPDGKGGITGGDEDINGASGPSTGLTINSSGSSYSIGQDNRGCLTVTNSAGTTAEFRFALGSISGTPPVATKGRIIEFDDTNGTGTRGSGIIRMQGKTSFASSLRGTYAFAFSGNDRSDGRFAIAGTLTADGAGNFNGGSADWDDAGVLGTNLTCTTCGTYSTSLDVNGRGTTQVTAFGFSTTLTASFVFYQVAASEAIFMSIDPLYVAPLAIGEALLETVPTGGFAPSSLSGKTVFHLSGASGFFPFPTTATIGLANANGLGGFPSVIVDTDSAGTTSGQTVTTWNYSVASTGRVALSGTTANLPVFYLLNANTGFIVGTDSEASSGFLEPQVGSSFNDSTLNVKCSFGTENPSGRGVSMNSGVISLNGSIGTFSGTADSSTISGLNPSGTIFGTYTVTPDGTGTITDQSGNPGVLIVISSSRFLLILDETTTNVNPSVTVVEQ